MGKPPARPSSLSRHPWRAQKLQLLQTAFRAAVPAVRQGLHWGKKWPCPVTSSLTRTEAVFGQAMAAQLQWPQCRLCPFLSPPVPSCPHSPATGKHFRQQPLLRWLSKKVYHWFCFPWGRNILNAVSHHSYFLRLSTLWPQVITHWMAASRAVLSWRCSCCRRWGTALEGLDSREQRKLVR